MLRAWRIWVPFCIAILITACSGSDQASPTLAVPPDAGDSASVDMALAGADTPDSTVPAPREWITFRSSHPFHIQTIAVGPVRTNGSRILVITEPPPDVSATALRAVDPVAMRSMQGYRWRMGYDGWVKDAVITLPAMSAEQLQTLLLRLHTLMFGTTYKAEFVSTDAVPKSLRPKLDLSVSAAELNRWLVIEKEPFAAMGVGALAPLDSIVRTGSYGEYFSAKPGLVAWVLPVHGQFQRYRRLIRQWTLDGDVILGAVGTPDAIAIVARERLVPTAVLPPLRSETVLNLAASGTAHLAQSYERTFVMAGKYDGTNDWAPIYLSQSLVDDEYGSLLNITDQLLKTWSQHGYVHYVNFRYAPPREYPFAEALSKHLHATYTTFNWNTKGAGYAIERNGVRVYALNRTGALPVSYFTGTDDEESTATQDAETVAYGYFAHLDDPNLVRVVQYAALYQLFQEFGVRATVTMPEQERTNPRAALASMVASLVAELDRDSAVFAVKANTASGQLADEIHQVLEAVHFLHSINDAAGDAAYPLLVDRLVEDPRDQISARSDLLLLRRLEIHDPSLTSLDWVRGQIIHKQGQVAAALSLLTGYATVDSARRLYAAAASRPSQGWIHTATIVQSWNTGPVRSYTGGHNLDAAITHIRSDADVARGSVHVIEEDGHLTVEANEEDVPALSSKLREIAGEDDAKKLEHMLNEELPKIDVPEVRERAVALPVDDRPLENRGLRVAESERLGPTPVSRPFTAEEAQAADLLTANHRPYVSVHRSSIGTYQVVIGTRQQVLDAPNLPSVLDVIAREASAHGAGGPGPIDVQLFGFAPLDADNFTTNIELAMRRQSSTDQAAVESVLRHDGVGEPAAVRAANTRLDFSRAHVTETREVEMEIDGVVHQGYEMTVDVPRVVGQSLLMRIVVIFKEGLRPALEAVQAVLNEVFVRLGADAPFDVAAGAIRSEMRHRFGTDVHVQHATDDIIIAMRSRHGTAPRAAPA
jgi:hypothetical protein